MNKHIGSPRVQRYYIVRQSDLPMSCPNPSSSQWDSHPKVYLHLTPNVRQACPYCGEVYLLLDDD